MTLFLLWYAVWFKNKIKTIMRTLLAWVSIFILYTTATGTTNAQTVYLSSDSPVSPVMSYLNRFLNLQPKRSVSPAYSAGNKAYFESFRDEIEALPEEEHLMLIASTLVELDKMSREEVKEEHDLDKDIAIAILKWIYDMVRADKRAPHDGVVKTTSSSSASSTDEDAPDLEKNDIYEIEVKEFEDNTYYIYTVHDDINIKFANFHGAKGSFFNCMYQQCNKVAFLTKATAVQLIFGNGEHAIIDLEDSSSAKKISDNGEDDEDADEDADEDETELMDEEDLLEESSNIFGDIL
jgi:hypothetical protein